MKLPIAYKAHLFRGADILIDTIEQIKVRITMDDIPLDEVEALLKMSAQLILGFDRKLQAMIKDVKENQR